jgi:hypothetical protein
MQPSEDLQADCLALLKRFLLNYRDFPRDAGERREAMREYRDWFLARCKTREEIAAVVDDAIQTRRRRPTLAELNDIHRLRYPPPEPAPQIASTLPELTPEERAQRDEFMRNWRAREDAEAERRRREWLALRAKPAPARTEVFEPRKLEPITPEDVERVVKERAAAKAEGGEE